MSTYTEMLLLSPNCAICTKSWFFTFVTHQPTIKNQLEIVIMSLRCLWISGGCSSTYCIMQVFFSTFLASECVLRYIWVCDINIMHIWCLLPLHLMQEQWAGSWYRAAFCAVSYFSWFKMLLVSYQCGYGILIATLRKMIGAVVQVRLASGLESRPLHHHAIRERLCHICLCRKHLWSAVSPMTLVGVTEDDAILRDTHCHSATKSDRLLSIFRW